MKHLGRLSLLIVRVLATSILALCVQIFLTIRYPDYLLWIQETVKESAKQLFSIIQVPSNYRVAYNLLNGDGILVHTVFIVLVFVVVAMILGLISSLFGRNR